MRRQPSKHVNLLLFLLTLLAYSLNLHGAEVDLPWKRHPVDNSSQGADGVRLRDVNGDGFMDVATGWEEGGVVRVYLNPGPSRSKEKWPAVTVGRVGSPEDAVFVDLDADGAVDVVSCCEGTVKTIWVHWAPGDREKYLDPDAWKTEAIPVARGTKQWMFCVPAQVDGRNGVDLVAGAKNSGAEIGWLESPENPRSLDDWKWHPIIPAGWVMSLFAIDMDGDGDPDVLASDRKGDHRGCLWLENPGSEPAVTHAWKAHRIGAGDKEFMFMTPVDMDRDGLLDVLAATRGSELVWHRRKAADGLSWERFTIELPDTSGSGKGVGAGDVNLDGRLDVVFSCEGAGGKSGVMWMSHVRNVTDRVWSAHELSGVEGSKFDLVQLLDLDGDGDLDVLTCEERDNLGVVWYENPSSR